jgi:UDP-glucose 4-epimerase
MGRVDNRSDQHSIPQARSSWPWPSKPLSQSRRVHPGLAEGTQGSWFWEGYHNVLSSHMLTDRFRPKSLVTGGAGFIGSHVTDELLKAGHEVVVLDDLSAGYIDNVNPQAEFVRASVTDPALIDGLFERHKFDYVFHLAAYAAEGLSHFIRRFNYANNVLGSVTLINNAIRYQCKCFVFTSSIAVYGALQTPMTEEMVPQPEDPYGIAKYAVELDLAAARKMFGINYIIFRPHNVYGERQNTADKYRNVIGIFMNQLMQGLPCTIFGDGTQTRAFTHIADVAPAIARSVSNPAAYNQVFNIGADIPYTVKDLAEMVQRAMGKHAGVQVLPARNEVVHAYCDHRKARTILDHDPTVTLDEGLQRMARWALRVGPRSSRDFEAIELEQGLPLAWKTQSTKA